MKTIILIVMIISTLIWADFTRTSYDTVIDNSTGLEWQDTSMLNISDWNLSTTVCEELTILEIVTISPLVTIYHYDWRLPNQMELLTIVDYTKTNPVTPTEFLDVNNSIYWASTTSRSDSNQAWGVDFSTGETKKIDKASIYNIRCVRAGALPIL